MSVLLDTNVLSEMAKPRPDANVVAYLSRGIVSYISVLTLHELMYGTELVKDSGKRDKLVAWVRSIREIYESDILPVTADVAEMAANLRVTATGKGRVLHVEDAIIAATAMEHKLTLVTGNTSNFKVTGVVQSNPWSVDG